MDRHHRYHPCGMWIAGQEAQHITVLRRSVKPMRRRSNYRSSPESKICPKSTGRQIEARKGHGNSQSRVIISGSLSSFACSNSFLALSLSLSRQTLPSVSCQWNILVTLSTSLPHTSHDSAENPTSDPRTVHACMLFVLAGPGPCRG